MVLRAQAITNPATLGATTTSLTIVIGGENFNYQVVGGNIELTNNFGTEKLNSNQTKIDTISFTKIGNTGGKETVQVKLSISSVPQAQAGPEIRTYQTTLGVR